MAEEKASKKPLPEITPVNQPFWDGAKAGKLMMQKCGNCSTWVFPPRPVCGDCASEKLEWVQVSGKGKVFCFTDHPRSRRHRAARFRPGYSLCHRLGRSRRRPAPLQQRHRLPHRQGQDRHAGGDRLRRYGRRHHLAEVQTGVVHATSRCGSLRSPHPTN